MNTNPMMYSTVSGELVTMVENKVAECFVTWKQYKEMNALYESFILGILEGKADCDSLEDFVITTKTKCAKLLGIFYSQDEYFE